MKRGGEGLLWMVARIGLYGCAHMRVGEGVRGVRPPFDTTPRNRLYASARLGRYVSGDTFAMARLG